MWVPYCCVLCVHACVYVCVCVVLGYLGRWTHAPFGTGSPWLVLTTIADHINATTHLSLPPSSFSLSLSLSHSCHLHSLHSVPDIINPLQSPETLTRAPRGAGQGLPRSRPPLAHSAPVITCLSNKHMVWNIHGTDTHTHTHTINLMADSRVNNAKHLHT